MFNAFCSISRLLTSYSGPNPARPEIWPDRFQRKGIPPQMRIIWKTKTQTTEPHEAGCHPVLLWFQHEKWLQRMNQKSFVIRFSPSLPLTSALSFPYTRALVAHCNSLKKDLLVFLLFSQVCLSISCLIWTYKSNSCSLSNTEVVFVITENHSNTP